MVLSLPNNNCNTNNYTTLSGLTYSEQVLIMTIIVSFKILWFLFRINLFLPILHVQTKNFSICLCIDCTPLYLVVFML